MNTRTNARTRPWRCGGLALAAMTLIALFAACSPSADVVDSGAVATPVTPDTTQNPTPSPSSDTPAETPVSVPSSEPDATAGPVATPEPTPPPPPRNVRVYYLRPAPSENIADPFIVPVARQVDGGAAVGRATLEQLLAGPTDAEQAAGYTTSIPADTILLDLDVGDGLATVDLSGSYDAGGGTLSMTARLAEVVFTLTQFPTVDAVAFRINGEPISVFSSEGIVLDTPVSRDDFRDLMPAIFVDSPAAGQTVDAPVRITGEAAVFEAVFLAQLRSTTGEPLTEPEVVMTDNGVGWGRFDATLVTPPDAIGEAVVVHVWASSAEDGRDIDILDVPVTVARG